MNEGEIYTMAVHVHETFSSYIEAGFTRAEAMELIKAHIMASQDGDE